MRLLSLERAPPPQAAWVLTLEVPPELLVEVPAVHVSRNAVRVEAAGGGGEGEFTLPLGEPDHIDEAQAVCKLQRKRGRLTVSWPAPGGASPVAAPAGAPAEDSAGHRRPVKDLPAPAAPLPQRASRPIAAAGAASVAPEDPSPAPAAPLPQRASRPTAAAAAGRPAQRASLDYSRFAGIGEGDEPSERPDALSQAARSAPAAPDGPAAGQKPAAAPRAPASLDYSRFETLNEDDATLEPAEVQALWRRHRRLRRMRGEAPLEFEEWQRCRSRLAIGPSAAAAAPPPQQLDAAGRGLWCKTNFEDDFEALAAAEDGPPEEECEARRPLATPEMLTAISSAPGARLVDATSWSREALQLELTRACTTDRTASLVPDAKVNKDVRIDVIVYEVKVGQGNAAVCGHGEGSDAQILGAYRFKVEASFCVSISERPAPGAPEPESADSRFMGDIEIAELASGVLPDLQAATKQMRTSLRSPKPPKKHMPALRPLLQRLELSLAYFAWRFEWRLLERAARTTA